MKWRKLYWKEKVIVKIESDGEKKKRKRIWYWKEKVIRKRGRESVIERRKWLWKEKKCDIESRKRKWYGKRRKWLWKKERESNYESYHLNVKVKVRGVQEKVQISTARVKRNRKSVVKRESESSH